ncbi:MAG: AAA family ATPase [Bacilli bacterium]
MKINKITLLNVGSYEGKTIFDLHNTDDNKNIIIIGGKNGSGKTTLFTAIRLCIYGYNCFGYQSTNSFYNKKITKFINNTCKLAKPCKASVEVDININNGHELDSYIILREWRLGSKNEFEEVLTIQKNNRKLNVEESMDFEKYIMHMIPPELFDLYFFDGENIADFFLSEGNNTQFKNAFLTLCGYDTFEIMNKNFKRVNSSTTSNKLLIDDYLSCKKSLEISESDLDVLANKLSECIYEIEVNYGKINELELKYKKNGGISQKEWDSKMSIIKSSERKRDEKNKWLKKIANDVIPLLIIKENIIQLKDQIIIEEENEKTNLLVGILNSEKTVTSLVSSLKKTNNSINKKDIKNALADLTANKQEISEEQILSLSLDEKSAVLHTVNCIRDFDELSIKRAFKYIKSSINKTKKINEELKKCNIDSVQEYYTKKQGLLNSIEELSTKRINIEKEIVLAEDKKKETLDMYELSKKAYEEELKKGSISDLSTRAIVFLDELQDKLFKVQIEKVERCFRKEVNNLMRKANFIDDISIDKNFNISIYRNERYNTQQIIKIISTYNEEQIQQIYGKKASNVLFSIDTNNNANHIIPMEIDKNTMSSGEKQIFIMALYKSLIELCRYEVPFVIDTPFARIDTEHRANITKYFFKELKGQVFILSTNEEINKDHLKILEPNILVTYILENNDNKRTVVKKDCYF